MGFVQFIESRLHRKWAQFEFFFKFSLHFLRNICFDARSPFFLFLINYTDIQVEVRCGERVRFIRKRLFKL